jgi:hypothetical protein
LFPPINALLLNLKDGLREHLFNNVGVLGKVNPLSSISLDCLVLLGGASLLLTWSPFGDDATIDAIPLLGVPFAGKEVVSGIDGGGIIDVDWWCLILDKIPRELFGLSLGANKFAVDAEVLLCVSFCSELC